MPLVLQYFIFGPFCELSIGALSGMKALKRNYWDNSTTFPKRFTAMRICQLPALFLDDHVVITWGISSISQSYSDWFESSKHLNGFSPYTWSPLDLSESRSTRAQYSRFTDGLLPPNSAGSFSWSQWSWRFAMLFPCTWIWNLKKAKSKEKIAREEFSTFGRILTDRAKSYLIIDLRH